MTANQATADKTPYQVLELDENCSFDDIKSQYKKLAKKYHPDVCKDPGAEHKFEAVKAAHDFLMKNHVEPLSAKIHKSVKDTIFAFKQARAAKKYAGQNPTPPGKIRVTKIREENLVDAMKRWQIENVNNS